MDVGLDREGSLAMASKYIQSYTGDQVHVGIQTDLLSALALVVIGDHAIQRLLRGRFGRINGDLELEIEREGQANHIESGTDIGGRTGRSDNEGRCHCGGRGGGEEERKIIKAIARSLSLLSQRVPTNLASHTQSSQRGKKKMTPRVEMPGGGGLSTPHA